MEEFRKEKHLDEMKMRPNPLIGLLVAGMLYTAMPVHAASVDFWFASQGDLSGTALSSIDVTAGSPFSFSVWYRTDQAWNHNTLSAGRLRQGDDVGRFCLATRRPDNEPGGCSQQHQPRVPGR